MTQHTTLGEQTMNLDCAIISTSGQRLHTFTAITPDQPGMSRALVRMAEAEAREWAIQHGMRVVSDIISQGVYRVWVEPIPAGRLATMRQIASTNARIAAQVAA